MNGERYKKIPICAWDEFIAHISEIQSSDEENKMRWIYRGVRRSDYQLATSLEREAVISGFSLSDLVEKDIERRIINDFRRRAHHYLTHLPDLYDLSDWLALMQHYGAPTRLLDWTYSPLIAAYFAIEGAVDSPCAVWAMQSENYTTRHTYDEIGSCKIEVFYKSKIKPKLAQLPEETKRRQFALIQYLIRHPTPGVFLVNPFRMSERSSIQQAVHLMPGDMTQSFENNLQVHDIERDSLTQLEIAVTPDIRKEFLRNLHRMNISRASIFPGLQGFSESMKTRVALPEILSF